MEPALKEVPVLGRSGFRRLAYAEWGPPDAARTVLCVHGVSRTGRDFDPLAKSLAEAGLRVIAPDLPGRGRSDWLASSMHYTDRAYTSAMAALIARLDIPAIDWVGTSLGGHIGMLLASEDATPIERLVLNDFGARVSASALRRIGTYLLRNWTFDTLSAVESHLREVHAPFGALSDEHWRHLSATSAISAPGGGYRMHYDPAIGGRFAIPLWGDVVLWPVWERIRCRVLLLRGEHSDLLTRETAEQMRTRGRAGRDGLTRLAEIPGCGHAPALEHPEQIELIKNFLLEGSS